MTMTMYSGVCMTSYLQHRHRRCSSARCGLTLPTACFRRPDVAKLRPSSLQSSRDSQLDDVRVVEEHEILDFALHPVGHPVIAHTSCVFSWEGVMTIQASDRDDRGWGPTHSLLEILRFEMNFMAT